MTTRPMLVVSLLLTLALSVTAVAATLPGQSLLPMNVTLAVPTFCPMATPEPLWVDPVTSPTDFLTQTITVYIGNGEAVTVTAESGIFAVSGSYTAFATPARVQIALLPGVTHHLLVAAKVRATEQYGCPFGNYVLSTRSDRYGQELVIQQAATPTATPAHHMWLPVITT